MENKPAQSITLDTPQANPPETPPTPQANKISKPLITALVLLFLATTGIAGYYVYQNYQSKKQEADRLKPYRSMLFAPSSSPKSSLKSIILKIPVIEYETPGNKLTKVIITGYEDKIINIGEEFIINPATLGYLYESSLGDIKLKLIEVNNNSIVLDVLADEIYDGSFYPRNTIEREEITDTKCLMGRPLAMDVHYEYCFTLSRDELQPSLTYTIEGRSTMPPPPSD